MPPLETRPFSRHWGWCIGKTNSLLCSPGGCKGDTGQPGHVGCYEENIKKEAQGERGSSEEADREKGTVCLRNQGVEKEWP